MRLQLLPRLSGLPPRWSDCISGCNHVRSVQLLTHPGYRQRSQWLSSPLLCSPAQSPAAIQRARDE
jgi:hypothetical protein